MMGLLKIVIISFQAPASDKILYILYITTVAIQSFSYAYSGTQISESVILPTRHFCGAPHLIES